MREREKKGFTVKKGMNVLPSLLHVAVLAMIAVPPAAAA
jgi:hypothetical protein